MIRKSRVMAAEMPARLQPVSADIGSRKTASENIAPIATQPIRPPRKTITQRYGMDIGDSPHLTRLMVPTGWYVVNAAFSERRLVAVKLQWNQRLTIKG